MKTKQKAVIICNDKNKIFIFNKNNYDRFQKQIVGIFSSVYELLENKENLKFSKIIIDTNFISFNELLIISKIIDKDKKLIITDITSNGDINQNNIKQIVIIDIAQTTPNNLFILLNIEKDIRKFLSLKNDVNKISFFNDKQELIMIFQTAIKENLVKVEDFIELEIAKTRKKNNFKINAAFSTVFYEEDYKNKIDETKEALSVRRVYENKNGLYFYNDCKNLIPEPINLKFLKNYIHSANFNSVEDTLNKLTILIINWYKKENYTLYFYMTTLILNSLYNKEYDNIKLSYTYNQILDSKTITELKQKLIILTKDIITYNKNNETESKERLTNKIISYINNNYSDTNLNMNKLSQTMGLSTSYIHLLLKEAKTTFVKQLTKARLKNAVELLLTKNLKIIEIAKECGFTDQYYFSRQFKKYYNKSPKEYKKEFKDKYNM